MRKINNQDFLNYLDELFPDAHCELNHNDVFTLLVAVMLSAQTTDKAVNNVTGKLFEKYPTYKELENANFDDICNIIKPIGIYKNKANNIISTAKELDHKFNGIVPNTIEDLTTLPGVGRKTASVVLIEGFKIPAFPVDTHIKRVAVRLGYSTSDDVLKIEEKLRKNFNESSWIKLHHQIIFFGRYFCTAKNPKCAECKLKDSCIFYNKNFSKTAR